MIVARLFSIVGLICSSSNHWVELQQVRPRYKSNFHSFLSHSSPSQLLFHLLATPPVLLVSPNFIIPSGPLHLLLPRMVAAGGPSPPPLIFSSRRGYGGDGMRDSSSGVTLFERGMDTTVRWRSGDDDDVGA